jgi:hypothetical protein
MPARKRLPLSQTSPPSPGAPTPKHRLRGCRPPTPPDKCGGDWGRPLEDYQDDHKHDNDHDDHDHDHDRDRDDDDDDEPVALPLR